MAKTKVTAKEYKKTYQNALYNLKGIEARIQQRATELVKKQPDVLYTTALNNDGSPITVKQKYEDFILYLQTTDIPDTNLTTRIFLNIIQKIEEYNEKKSPYIQGKLFNQ